MPLKLLREFALMGERNSQLPIIKSDAMIADEVVRAAEKIEEEGIYGDLLEAEVIPFSSNEIVLIRNGEISSENFSLCPIANELFKVKRMERIKKVRDKEDEKEDEFSKQQYEYWLKKMLKGIEEEQERREEESEGGRYPREGADTGDKRFFSRRDLEK